MGKVISIFTKQEIVQEPEVNEFDNLTAHQLMPLLEELAMEIAIGAFEPSIFTEDFLRRGIKLCKSCISRPEFAKTRDIGESALKELEMMLARVIQK